jgi:L-ribulose-5-phosphate 4-epimerase
VARLALHTTILAPGADPLPAAIRDKHFLRKHGRHAYYGQP